MRFSRALNAAVAASVLWACAAPALGQEWVLYPSYDLPRRAGVLDDPVHEGAAVTSPLAPAPLLMGQPATESRQLLEAAPAGDMTLELWVTDHVNQPVGVLLTAGGVRLGYHDGKAVFGPGEGRVADLAEEGLKEFWRDLVLVRRKNRWTLFENGVKIVEADAPARVAGSVRLDAYLAQEPFMQVENLVHAVTVDARALTDAEVAARFQARARLVEEGVLYADRFHFTQPPYLNTPTATSMDVSFELDRPSKAILEYGETGHALQRVALPEEARQHGYTITGLKADTPYFYRVTATDASGANITSKLLSFRTAPPAGRPFTFVVSGDTEGRPHINNRMSGLMWQERPNLLLIAGDLTDGGDETKRVEWTHEYFQGMGPFFGRVPTIAAPGNGEGELKWYRQYHRNPGAENYFSVVYGDVEFFVLDSNLATRDRQDPGFRARQKAWLDQALKASRARWKIAIHHHDVRTSDEDDYGFTWDDVSTYGDGDVQTDFLPLYEANGVDLVFFAHLHSYERSWPIRDGKVDLSRGVTYVQVGGLGGNLEDFAPNKPWFSRKTFRDHHYVSVAVTSDRLDLQAVDSQGRTRDVFSIEKTAEPAQKR